MTAATVVDEGAVFHVERLDPRRFGECLDCGAGLGAVDFWRNETEFLDHARGCGTIRLGLARVREAKRRAQRERRRAEAST